MLSQSQNKNGNCKHKIPWMLLGQTLFKFIVCPYSGKRPKCGPLLSQMSISLNETNDIR